jgi:peptidoglycan/LPS O-acetylase OafA/YrhL
MERVKGLDQLRFIMAFIVVLGHGALPRFDNIVYRGIIGNAFVGIAAVMVFFILSGFVIHYPYAKGDRKIKISEFYFKRLLRIIIPSVIAMIIYHYTLNLFMGVVWSLICEAVYYLLYPFVLKFIKRLDLIICLAFLFSYGSTILYSLYSEDNNLNFHRLGLIGAWISGFPMWLLGVKLSEVYVKFKDEELKISFSKITLIRIGIICLSSVASILRFHYGIAYGYTLPVFSLFAFYWLKKELIFYTDKEENKILAYGGTISFSIYLIHVLVMVFFTDILKIKMLNLGNSLGLILVILFISWGFYMIVEKPSHRFSRSIKFRR